MSKTMHRFRSRNSGRTGFGFSLPNAVHRFRSGNSGRISSGFSLSNAVHRFHGGNSGRISSGFSLSNAMHRFPPLYDVLGCCLLWTMILLCLALIDHFHVYTQEQQKTDVLRASYAALCEDLEFFPLAAGADGTEDFSFENSWMAKRTFGGERGHEGCDIFGKENKRDYYPVVSMTAGRVEKVGWLTQGGNRIGIRSRHGGYFYYAHLSSYARAFHVGDSITAGQLLGFMGDTGYGAEGTTGMFMVHLHVGVYLRLPSGEELSVNPYWMLESLQEKKCRITDAYHCYSVDEYAIITTNGYNMSCILSPGLGANGSHNYEERNHGNTTLEGDTDALRTCRS